MARQTKNKRRKRNRSKTGLAPGSLVYTGPDRDRILQVRALHYDADTIEDVRGPDPVTLATCATSSKVCWVDLDGVHDPEIVGQVADIFHLHPLWVEDILNTSTRPKVEWMGDKMFVVLRLLYLSEEEGYTTEQVALVLGPGWVLSFQEQPGDAWDQVRERLLSNTGRLRRRRGDYLLHALMDAVVDRYMVIVQELEPRLDALEDQVLSQGGTLGDVPQVVNEVRGDLSVMRAAVWPMRDAVSVLVRGEGQLMEESTLPFFRDLSDHVHQLLQEAITSARERLQNALELQVALAGHQMNEVMRVLTVVSTVFIPLSFLAGLYGMNFRTMPELEQPWGYPALLVVMAGMAGTMLAYFRRKGWF